MDASVMVARASPNDLVVARRTIARYSGIDGGDLHWRSDVVRDPLLRLLKQVREAHGVSQEQVDLCMQQALGTYRHIEVGRRRPPDLLGDRDGRNDLVSWVYKFEDCVNATFEERRKFLETLSHDVVNRFALLLHDIERRAGT